ncbi:hypothetical protein HW35_12370 [Bacillus sp. X1(2014)]|nr:hypothetical protein HW35_12370 [Bacillus sp. X1(2014)]
MEIEIIQMKSANKHICEDYFISNKEMGLFAVLDGATPISNFVNQDGHNGAVLASRIVGNALNKMENTSIKTTISEANLLLANEMKTHRIDTSKKEELWSTCLALVKVYDNEIHFAQIGDCMIFATTRTGEWKILSKDMVFGISERARQHRENERRLGRKLPPEEYYQIKKHSLIYNKSLANKENGYAVLNGDPAAIQFLHEGILQKDEYRGILLITDGLFPKDRNWGTMLSHINQNGLYQYAKNLIEYEQANNLTQDDKTGIWIQFS